ncbi:MAG TPA: hypothetical protein VFA18_13055, partial [Gemmataceae bacterium]|nr:hypothetical protein [Gemmataceae bacterium]
MWFFFSRKTRRTTTKSSSRPTFRPRVRALEDRCLMSAGMLDPTFNPTGSPPGTAVAPPVGSNDDGYACLVQPSGKVVVAGKEYSGKGITTMLAEFGPNGSLDPGFGSGGIVTTSKSGAPAGATAGVLYPTASGDQKILVVGPASNAFGLVRYNADGSLDTSFNRNGIVNTSFKQAVGQFEGITLVPNGTSPKIVVAGDVGSFAGVELARYNSDGSLDTTFGSKGTVYVPIPGGMNVSRLTRDPVNGDLVVFGSGQLAAFTSAGALDSSFGTNGVLNTGGGVYGLTVDNAGRILVGASGGVARYSLTGTLDTSWGGTGIVAVPSENLAIQQDGKVLAVSSSPNGVYRLNADGSLDNSFGTNGFAGSGPVGINVGSPPTITLAPNGDIVVGGNSSVPGHWV